MNSKKSKLALILSSLCLSASVVHAQTVQIQIPDPDPEIERRSFQVADGFEVNLFAADPLLAKPIQMNFDPAGRLWVATSEVYPQIKPGQKANDKIIVLEDTKGVGRADKVTVFADGLLIPTGIEPSDGEMFVREGHRRVMLVGAPQADRFGETGTDGDDATPAQLSGPAWDRGPRRWFPG